MADALTALEQHVAAIETTLNADPQNNRVEVKIGELGQHQWGAPRRILFEPMGGELGNPQTVGVLEVETLKYGKPLRSLALNVKAHIVAESHTALWVLWQNVVIASRNSLKTNSQETDFDLQPEPMEAASHLPAGSRYMTQTFIWILHLFDRLVPLPPYGQDVGSVTALGDLVPLATFTNEVEDPIPDFPDGT